MASEGVPKKLPRGAGSSVLPTAKSSPLEPNSTSAGRAANRRVEVKIGTTE